jgi:hypothetical protein
LKNPFAGKGIPLEARIIFLKKNQLLQGKILKLHGDFAMRVTYSFGKLSIESSFN